MSLQVVIHTDGGSRGNPGPAGIGVWVVGVDPATQTQTELFSHGETIGLATNNEAEYRAFLRSLTWLQQYLQEHSVVEVTWKLDSMLVVEQLSRRWKIKEPRMLEFAQQAWRQLAQLDCRYTILAVPRAENKRADALVNQALDAASV